MDGGEPIDGAGSGAATIDGASDGVPHAFDDRVAGLHDALRRLGRAWAFGLWSFTGVGSPEGAWIMPVLYVAPALLARALWRLAAVAPAGPRLTLRACVALIGPAWALGLWGSLHGGPFSGGVRGAQVCGTLGLTLCCASLASWCTAANMRRVEGRWAKGAWQGALALGLAAALAAEDTWRGGGSLVGSGRPTDVDGLGIALLLALAVVATGALVSAAIAIRATRASLVDLRRSLAASASGPTG